MIQAHASASAITGASAAGAAVFGAITQSDITVWAAVITGVGGALLWLGDKRRRSFIETDSLRRASDLQAEKTRIENEAMEREAILRDARKDIEAGRREIHDLRDQMNLQATKYLAEIQSLKIELAILRVNHPMVIQPSEGATVIPVPPLVEPNK